MNQKAYLIAGPLLAALLVLAAGCTSAPGTGTRTATVPPTPTPVVPQTAVTAQPATTPGTAAPETANATTQATTPVPMTTFTPAQPETVTIDLVVKNFIFNTSTITVPAGAAITIHFDNQDSGAAHNFALYDTPSRGTTLFKGKLLTGVAQTVYTFTSPAQPGTYHFQSDPHASRMFGTFVVQ